jgi:hypothetical protein
MDAEMTNNAIEAAQFDKETIDRVWIKNRKPFEVF